MTVVHALCLVSLLQTAVGDARRSMIDIEVSARTVEQARSLARRAMLVYDRDGHRVRAYADDTLVRALRDEGLLVRVLSENYSRDLEARARLPARSGADYVSVDALPEHLQQIAARSANARVEVLGTSVQGRPIVGLRVGVGLGHAVRILGGHHGDERSSVEVVLALAGDYVDQVQDGSIAALSEVLFVPAVNPDGVQARTRHNARGIDLNRNYNFGFADDEFAAGEHAFSEPEVRAIALDNEHHRYAVSLSYHSGAFNIGYPWNYTTAAQLADAQFVSLSQRYKALVPDSSFWVTRGAEWYISYGDTNDYSWGHFGGIDFTVEVSADKTPAVDALADVITQQRAAAFDWLTHHQDIQSIKVVDNAGRTLPGRVQAEALFAVADEVTGVASLLVPEGTQAVVSSPGFVSQTVNVSDGMTVTLVEQDGAAEFGSLEVLSKTKLQLRDVTTVVSQVVARRPGELNITWQCEQASTVVTCTLPPGTAGRRPGAYSIVATGSAAEHQWLRAWWIDDAFADPAGSGVMQSATTDGLLLTGLEAATAGYLLEADGRTTALTAGTATLPPGSTARIVWAYNGQLFSAVHAVEPVPSAPSGSDTGGSTTVGSSARKVGCAASRPNDSLWFAMLLAPWLIAAVRLRCSFASSLVKR
jgi:hypothetical protein